MPADSSSATPGSVLIDEAADWLVARALDDTQLGAIFEGCCLRLHAAGIPLWRAHLTFRTLHPLFSAVALTWTAEQGFKIEEYHHGSEDSEEWFHSPLRHLIQHGIPRFRRRLSGTEAILDFPVLEQFQLAGATDYLAYVVSYGEPAGPGQQRDGIVGSWLTDRSDGFGDADIRHLRRIEQRLALACKIKTREQIVRNVLSAYLGKASADKVLRGRIRRGDMESIYAVIWYSDLRNSTNMADAMDPHDYLPLLNRYFESAGGAVLDHGGEVLRFPGDAVLGIFPIGAGRSHEQACRAALEAARDARARLRVVNDGRAAGVPALAFGLGLHVGEVMFGNIGVPERVEFTVIGPAANEVARLESLTKELGCETLMSDQFTRHLREDWVALGTHRLRGVGAPCELFTLELKPEPEAAG